MFKYKKITLIITAVLVFFSNSFMYAESINDEEVFIKNGSRDKKLIALTFDDGPHPKETNQVLDVLNKYNVKGTFFIAGKHANWYPNPLVRASKEGHEIGNHTFNHPDITNLTNAQLEEEILKCEEILIKLTGKKPTLFRPPYGSYKQEELASIAKKLNYKIQYFYLAQYKTACSRVAQDRASSVHAGPADARGAGLRLPLRSCREPRKVAKAGFPRSERDFAAADARSPETS